MRECRLASLLLAGVTLSCASTAPSQRVEKFIAGLECGLAMDSVGALAMGVKGLSVHDVDEGPSRPSLVVSRRSTLARLWFDDSGLLAHRVTWSYPITNFGSRLKVNLCTGERFVELSLVGPSSFAGSPVEIDGRHAGVLSNAGTMTVDVPLGQHRVEVFTPPGSWTAELRYASTVSGYDRLEISEIEPRTDG